jgi:hypothetical protein
MKRKVLNLHPAEDKGTEEQMTLWLPQQYIFK